MLDDEAIELYACKTGNCLAFRLSCMKEKLNTAISVLKMVLSRPTFPEKSFRRELEANLQEIEETANDPKALAMVRITEMMYQGHPCGLTLEDKVNALNDLSVQDLKDFYFERVLDPRNVCFAFAGDLSQQEAADIVQDLCQAIPWSQKVFASPAPLQFPAGDSAQVYELDKEQAVVTYAFPGIPVDSPDRHAMALIENAFGSGMSSRLFRSIREERGLAYYAGMTQSQNPGNGLIICYAGTQPETAEQVAEIFEEERLKMIKHGLTQEEFDAAKNSILFLLEDVKQDTVRSLQAAAFYEYIGVGCDEPANKIRQIREITLDTVNQTIARIFDTKTRAIAVVSP